MNELIFINKPLIECIKCEVNETFYKKIRPGQKLKHNLNDIIEGILFMCKTGVQIKYVDYKGIKGPSLMYHFYKWTDKDIFQKCWEQVYLEYQKKCKYNTNLKHLSVDCTKIKSINGVDCKGKNSTDRGRNGTHLSVITDLLGVPVGYFLEAAKKKKNTLLDKTFKNKIYKRKKKTYIYGDKGYSGKDSIEVAKNNGCELIAPNKKNFVKKLFPETKKIRKRYVIEAFFSWIKSYKRIILRYDKYIENFKNFLLVAFSMVICKKLSTGVKSP